MSLPMKLRELTFSLMLLALFTIAKTWNQPKCPETDDWIKKIWYIYTMEYYSAIKKDQIVPFASTWMDLEGIMISPELTSAANRPLFAEEDWP
uniref:DUF1725 domain-containing protein n=1 Tax=Equus asinus TaxID=9793 RepID=A0A9L0JCX0_EQUAS